MAVVISGAKTRERHQVAHVSAQPKDATGVTVELAYVDRGDTGKDARRAAEAFDVELEVVKHTPKKTRRRRKDSFCRRVAGWSSGPSADSGDTAGSLATTSDSSRHSPPPTGMPSSASHSPASNSHQVPHML